MLALNLIHFDSVSVVAYCIVFVHLLDDTDVHCLRCIYAFRLSAAFPSVYASVVFVHFSKAMDYDYFNGRGHDVLLEHRRRINMQLHERFRIRDNNNPLDLSVTEFCKLYRMPQNDVVNLCNLIRPYIPQRRSPQQVPLLRKVLVALSFYACGAYQRMVGRSIDCSVSQTSVSRIIREITTALNHPHILSQFIRFPMNHEDRAAVIHRNERLGMPRVLGFIDGFLLKVSYLPHDRERQSYFSRKGYLSINTQIICDADLNILNVDARWHGSVTDNQIWEACTARGVVEQAYWQDRCWLLGDSGYFTAPWLHVPLPQAAPGTPEYEYTRLHCRCRNSVERCIGVLKSRWRSLGIDRCVNYKDAAYAGRIVNACCVLHNYCLQRGVLNPAPLNEIDPDDPPHFNDLPLNVNIQARGLAEMQYLINFVNDRRVNRNNIVNAV